MTLHDALAAVSTLSTDDKRRLIEVLSRQVSDAPVTVPLKNVAAVFGAFRDLGRAPSLEVIADARHEMWRRFREDDGESFATATCSLRP